MSVNAVSFGAKPKMKRLGSRCRVHGNLNKRAPIAIRSRRRQAVNQANHTFESGAGRVLALMAAHPALSKLRN